MRIGSDAEYRISQQKLAQVQDLLARMEDRSAATASAEQASHRSVRAYANQIIEELIEYELAHGIQPRTAVRAAKGEFAHGKQLAATKHA